MAITITSFMTSGGAPYSSYTPTISIWKVSDGTQVVTSQAMTNIASAHYKYNFTGFVYGVSYVYLVTGDSTIPPSERYQTGSIMQENADRTIAQVVTDGGNSATAFKTDRTESTTDFWKDALVNFLTGNLAGQVKKVTAYDGTNKILTLTNGFTGTPIVGDYFLLVVI